MSHVINPHPKPGSSIHQFDKYFQATPPPYQYPPLPRLKGGYFIDFTREFTRAVHQGFQQIKHIDSFRNLNT
jgi:hypothetical protein